MSTPPQTPLTELGLVGLGVMGANLGMNIAEHGFTVIGYDREAAKGDRFTRWAQEQLPEPGKIRAYNDLASFIAALRRPRAILALVPAGAPVDAVIRDLSPHLEAGDILVDGGNSYFRDTDRRIQWLAEQAVHFMGMGVSGGEAGARHGPSLMPGGEPTAWERLGPLLEAAAAKAQDAQPCVAWLGTGSAGHYVKMVHNGIEYGLMQLIAESYDLMHRGLGLSQEAMYPLYRDWARGPMGGFLLEITADILQQRDPLGKGYLLDKILDSAQQKGTGQWTSQESLALHVPAPIIHAAVTQRVLSAEKSQRQQASRQLSGPAEFAPADREHFLNRLGEALHSAMQLTYAQGMHLLQAADQQYDYRLRLEAVASIWRGGCIIRSRLLEDLRAVYQRHPALMNPVLDPAFATSFNRFQASLREVSGAAAARGIPAPTFAAALNYYDTYRSARLPANLLQAQRDYFGSHTFERTDREGRFHVAWDRE